MSNILINFAIGSYADLTAMPPDRAKIIGLSRHRLSTDRKRLSLFVLLIMTVCIYCFGTNQQIDTFDNSRIFLENIGIDKTTVLPTDFDAVHGDDLILTLDQRDKLLNGVIPQQEIGNPEYTVYLCAIRPVSDSIVIVQFGIVYSDMEAVYIATYSNDAILKDSIFAGNNWDFGDAESVDEDTELIHATVKSCEFSSPNKFTLTLKYREILKSFSPPKEIERYSKEETDQYEVLKNGRIIKISE
ncbi:hypothetical protein [Bacteroides caecimuris]|uniref:hypothetical protein n=1 Tax=Bacteroides caecimuris TaxID=1796613 RepID=UPI00272ABC8C|nr:hypothetical protein [Bacteroides caecimuris]